MVSGCGASSTPPARSDRAGVEREPRPAAASSGEAEASVRTLPDASVAVVPDASAEAAVAETHIGPECPWGVGVQVPSRPLPECPTWTDGDDHFPVVHVRARDVVLTQGNFAELATFPRTLDGWRALRAALHEIAEAQSATVVITTSSRSFGGIGCAVHTAHDAGFGRGVWPIRPCATSDRFTVEADGRVRPPRPVEGDTTWRDAYRLAGSCTIASEHRCDEIYQERDRILENARETGRDWCRGLAHGRWTQRACPTEDLVGSCESRAETYPRVSYRYAAPDQTAETVRARCRGTFVPAR